MPESEHFVIVVNGDPVDVPGDCTVRGLLSLLAIGGRRVAVAVNRDVVPRAGYDTTHLAKGDRIEILEAVGGG